VGFGKNAFNANRTVEEILLEKLCDQLGKKARENTIDGILALFRDYTITGGRRSSEVITPGRPDMWLTQRIDYVLDEGDRVTFSGQIDAAEARPVDGGIDLDENKMLLDVQKDGQGAVLRFDPAELERFQSGDFTGVVPVIVRITAAADPRMILGIN
jgi:hypothetical protein